MKQGFLNKIKILVLPLYLVVQILIGLTITHLYFNLAVHVPLMMASIITYFTVALKNPGFVIPECEDKMAKKLPSVINVPTNVNAQANINKIEYNNLNNEDGLGLQSNIKPEEEIQKQNKPKSVLSTIIEKPQENGSCVKEGQIGKGLVIEEPSGFVPCPSRLKVLSRNCDICNLKQELRVRHCLDCGKCVHTFDHHCIWLNNCIGEKNKFHFLLYLIVQLSQLFVLGGSLIFNLIKEFKVPHLFLCIGVFLIGIVLVGILLFHFSLIVRNLTTWEHLRWMRISYLNIFSRQKLGSLFDRGLKSNISIFLWGSFCNDPVDWMRELSPKAHECLLPKRSLTERRLSCVTP